MFGPTTELEGRLQRIEGKIDVLLERTARSEERSESVKRQIMGLWSLMVLVIGGMVTTFFRLPVK